MDRARKLALGCLAFGIAGGLSRLLVPTVQTRTQILIFCCVAVVFHVAASAYQSKRQRYDFIFLGASAVAAILAVRFALEGIPSGLVQLLR